LTYYCARCDAFTPPDHFDEADHVATRARKYSHSLDAWVNSPKDRHVKFYRPEDAENIVASAAAADEKAELESRSPFFRWLMGQLKREDPIGDLARDTESDRSFPRTINSLETIRSHLIRKFACGKAIVALDEAWKEFKEKRTVRSGITLSLRFAVFKRDSYRCQICGGSAADGLRLEVDHRTPVSKGGTNDNDNLCTLCFECNRGKRDHDL
jgi:uncharacterized protein YozE (UPF0346 family)